MRARRPVRNRATRVIALVAGDHTQILDLAGPAEVFSRCARILAEETASEAVAYTIHCLTIRRRTSITTTAGLNVMAHGHYSTLSSRPDTVLVVGGDDVERLELNSAFIAWLQRQARQARRVGSICTGAFALARAGILDEKRAATHWAWAARLATQFPRVHVEADPLFVRDGNVVTSAGVTAGIDLALSLVEEDHGAAMAGRIARDLVLYLRRAGGQSQFSAPLAAQVGDRAPIRELQLWLPGQLKQNLRLEVLAARAGMSERNFTRVFTREIGASPGQYVDRLRVDAAGVRLVTSSAGLKRIATDCGFRSADVLRRTFQRVLGVTAHEYRQRFREDPRRAT